MSSVSRTAVTKDSANGKGHAEPTLPASQSLAAASSGSPARTISTLEEKPIALVVAVTRTGGIGKDGDIPWPKLRKDMEFFVSVTTTVAAPQVKGKNHANGQGKKPNMATTLQNAVIMGRKTWESIPLKFRPLKNRVNIVLTAQLGPSQSTEPLSKQSPKMDRDFYQNLLKHDVADDMGATVRIADSLTAAFQMIDADPSIAAGFIIGGARAYREALKLDRCQTVHATQVLKEYPCDAFFPWPLDPDTFQLTEEGDVVLGSGNAPPYQFSIYKRRINPEEMQYLRTVKRVIDTGVRKKDRTGVGTLSLFGTQMRFSLKNGRIPVLTTKRVFWRGVVEELLWIIRGSTDSNALAKRRVHIWDGNGSREFLDKSGFTDRAQGDLGPVYGFQWRHFGAKYTSFDEKYDDQGVDQLSDVIQLLRTNPYSRRILLCAWNAADLKKMALPPCHVLCQFFVSPERELSCIMYQRSCDLGLGVPFNMASYALLTHMMAAVTGLKPGEFVHVMGDHHVYLNHVDALKVQLGRVPKTPFPRLRFKHRRKEIDEFTPDDFELVGYEPQKTIKMDMAV